MQYHALAAKQSGHAAFTRRISKACLVERIREEALLFEGDIPVHVSCCPPQDGNIDPECLIMQVIVRTEPDEADDVGL